LATDGANSVLAADSKPLTYAAYSPYGHRESATLLRGLPGFNGEQPDPLTGHYLLGNGYRAFNPVLMRFNSPDSLSPSGRGGLNAYAYCLGDPINRVDPTGHWGWLIGGLVAGAAAAGAVHFATKKASPEVSSALGVIALGLGVTAAGLGGVRLMQKFGNTLHQRLVASGGLSGRNAGGLGIGARTASGLIPPSATLEGMPKELLDKITAQLSSQDMVRLSMTSSRVNRAVNGLSKSRFDLVMSKTVDYGQVIIKADDIGFGRIAGIAPAQAKRAGFSLKIAQEDYPYPMIHLLPDGRVLRYGGVQN
jgi:RHS repeat-associated protein